MTELRANKGFHPILEEQHPYMFIDSCMQAWPDADYGIAHRHGVTAYAVTGWMPHAPLSEALEGLMFWHLVAREHPHLTVADSAADIRRAWEEGGATFIITAQCGDFISDRLHRLAAFYRLGLRILIPAYNATNLICDGCLDRTDGGLTRFGQLVVRECNRIGLLMDCSHLGRRAGLEIAERSRQPVVFTHSNARAIVDNPRNIDDEQIAACAATGGVVGLAPFGPFVLRDDQTDWPTLEDFIDHIDHVANVTGSAAHIGIGTDMSLGTYPLHEENPWGEPKYARIDGRYSRLITGDVRSPMRALRDFHTYPHVLRLIDRLAARGYSEEDIAGILGENFLRVFSEVWK